MIKEKNHARKFPGRVLAKGFKLIATAKCACEDYCGAVENIWGKKVSWWLLAISDPTNMPVLEDKDYAYTDLKTLRDVKDYLKKKYYGTHLLQFPRN